MESAQEREIPENEIFETDVDVPIGLSEKFQSFREKEKINADDEVIFYVYKFDNPISNKRSLLDKTTNEPDEHEIGCMYGSGKYDIFMSVRGRKARSYRVFLHKRYDELMEGRKKTESQLPVNAGMSQNGMFEQLATIRTLIEALKPIINPGDPSTMANAYGEMMKGMFEMQQNMMQQSMEGIMDMRNRFMDQVVIDDDVEDEEPEEPEKDGVLELIQQYLPLIEQYLPKILQGGTQSKVIASTIRSLPIFKNLMEDRGKLVTLIEYLKNEYGPEKTNALLVHLGVLKSRPGKNAREKRQVKASIEDTREKAQVKEPVKNARRKRQVKSEVTGGK